MIKICDMYCFMIYFYYGIIKKYSSRQEKDMTDVDEQLQIKLNKQV